MGDSIEQVDNNQESLAVEDAETERTVPKVNSARSAPPLQQRKQGFFGKLFNAVIFSSRNRFLKEGENYLRKHDYEQALIAFQTALKNDETCSEAYIGVARVLEKKGGTNNFKSAVNILHKAAEIDPFQSKIYDVAASLYDKLGKKKEAMSEKRKQQIIKTLKTNPNDSIANNNLGVILLRQKKIDQAIEYLNKSAKNDLSYQTGHSNLATALYQRASMTSDVVKKNNDLDLALKSLERVLRLGGDNPLTLVMIAKVGLLKKEYDMALDYCNRAISIDNTLKEAYATKKVIFERTAKLQEAESAYKSYQSLKDAEKKVGS